MIGFGARRKSDDLDHEKIAGILGSTVVPLGGVPATGLPLPASEPKAGMVWSRPDNWGVARVMGVVENYVVARRKGCSPFLLTVREWKAEVDAAASVRSQP